MIVGRPDQLHFEIRFSAQGKHLGLGSLRASLGTSHIWCDEAGRGIKWTWIDLLEQLARSWPFLKYEESAPPGEHDGMLSLLRKGHPATPDFEFASPTEVPRETYTFLRRHNLATGVEGLYLPSFSLLREGRMIWVASLRVTRLMDLQETIETLAELGDALSKSIASAEADDRSRLAVDAWRNREPSMEAALQIALGPNQLALVPPGRTAASYFEVEEGGDYASPLLLAARMSAAVPLEHRRNILEFVRAVPAIGVSPLLETLSLEAQKALPAYERHPHKQGELLAQWARGRFNLLAQTKADPERILRELGVQIRLHHFGVDMIDAVGCWSQNHGPAILINLDGVHAQALEGRRATLAHELAHVLVDRRGSLPAAEVLGDDAPRYPEQRASAFAAEFLLPKSVAAERIRNSTDVKDAMSKLRSAFDVSWELAAWQVINGPAFHTLDRRDQQLLRTWTSDPRYALF